MPGDDLERLELTQHPAVVKSDHDVRHDPQPGRDERRERCLEVGHLPVQVVDFADRRLGPDHIEHRDLDPGLGETLGAPPIHESRVRRDAQVAAGRP